jgi:hypothetical protein
MLAAKAPVAVLDSMTPTLVGERPGEDDEVSNLASSEAAIIGAAPLSRRLRSYELPAALSSILSAYGLRIQDVATDAAGRYVLFATAGALSDLDRNGVSDIYWYDSLEDRLVLVSACLAGGAGNGPSLHPRMDGVGETVVYQSAASNLVADDTNGVSDIFLVDTYLWVTERVSETPEGWQAEGPAEHPALDAVGARILYDRRDEAGFRQIYGYTPDTLTTDTLSLTEDEDGERVDNHHPGISPDGRYLTYLESTKAMEGDPDTCTIHVYDQETDVFQRLACPEELASGGEFRPFFSADGSTIEWVEKGVGHLADGGAEGESAKRIVVGNPFRPLRDRPRLSP